MKRALVLAALAASVGCISASQAIATTERLFAGVWTATDCATWWQPTPEGNLIIHCDVWGDASTLSMAIGSGTPPRVVVHDSYASDCDAAGLPTTSVATGSGEYFQVWLIVAATRGCGPVRSATWFELYHDVGSDTLWNDDDGDGWGLVWSRAAP